MATTTSNVRKKDETIPIQIKMPRGLKKAADELFKSMGMDTGTAVRVFLTQAVGSRRMPFEVVEPVDINGFTIAQRARILEAKAQLDAGLGVVHDIIED